MPKVLLIDGDRSAWPAIRRGLDDIDIEVVATSEVEEGLQAVGQAPDVVLLDVALRGRSGLDVARRIHDQDPNVPVIFLSSGGGSATAIEAMKQGACDYLLKPLDPGRLRAAVSQAIRIRQSGRDAPHNERAEPVEFEGGIVGRSPAMQDVFKAIGRAAPQNVTILIQGESGTGKELVARAIHDHSLRAQKVFLAVNCAAIPEQLLESELFGHEKGSFTGADEQRIGKFERCSGGTIFLDEIGDMPPLVQGKVLRVLQEQRFERVGGSETIDTDVRIIAATNRDLKRMVAEGTFREDLYYRLDGFGIRLPPLRERGDDLVLLLQHALQKLGRELGKPGRILAPEALERLQQYTWPGNVRELEAVIRQALLQTTGPVILADFLPDSVRLGGAGAMGDAAPGDLVPLIEDCLRRRSHEIYAEATDMMERYVLTRVLRETHGNQSQAAKLLGITRGCLRARIRKLHISLGAKITHD